MDSTPLDWGSLTRRTLIGLLAGALAQTRWRPGLAQNAGEALVATGDQASVVGPTTILDSAPTARTFGLTAEGTGMYADYDWKNPGAWQTYGDQPVAFQWQPAALAFQGAHYTIYNGVDERLYLQSYRDGSWSGWSDITRGDYAFCFAPYAIEAYEQLTVFCGTIDNRLYVSHYDGATWTDWVAIDDGYGVVGQPHAIPGGGLTNVFWTGADRRVVWNRFNGKEWTGAKVLPGPGRYAAPPTAVTYEPTRGIFAYGVTTGGRPAWNQFQFGGGWSGWEVFDGAPSGLAFQPSAIVVGERQVVVFGATNGHAYRIEYDEGFGEWTDLGPNHAFDPEQYLREDTHYYSFTGAEGAVYAVSGDDPSSGD